MTAPGHDLTITTRRSFDRAESEGTVYLQFDRKREESRFSDRHGPSDRLVVTAGRPRIAVIRRCDLGIAFRLNLDDREYDSAKLPMHRVPQEGEAPVPVAPRDESLTPTVVVETTTVDTGERKEAFGFTARRVAMTRKHIPLSVASRPQEVKTIGWYIDLDPRISCEPRPRHTFLSVGSLNARGERPPREIPQFKDIGASETGYPIDVASVTMSTLTLPDGTTRTLTNSSRTWVVALSTDPLDAALFEVPPGFRKVEAVRQR